MKTRFVLLLIAVVLLESCSGHRKIYKAYKASLVSGEKFAADDIEDAEIGEEDFGDSISGFRPEALFAPAPIPFCERDFDGSVREEAKTTYVKKPKKTFDNVEGLMSFLQSNNASDADMEQKDIRRSSPRLPEEAYLVTIKKAYIYAITKEADNDYHLIFGDNSSLPLDPKTTMNAEVSGLPVNFTKDEARLKEVRDKACQLFSGQRQCTASADTPLFFAIKIKGCLFYDMQHKGAPAKCGQNKSGTAWELHPVYDISVP